jgi:ABC-type amino acid transport substrate-binding protein
MLLMAAALLAACGSASSGSSGGTSPAGESSSAALDTLTPGILMQALEPYMPYTGVDNPPVVEGLDGEIITAVADKLGLEMDYKVMDFTGMLAAVQTHRADTAYGGMAWTAERAEVGLFTDAYFYSPQTLTTLEGKPTYPTLDSIKGKKIGTMTGTVQAPAIKAAGGQLVVQPTVAGLLDQLAQGRIDAAVIDPLLAAYTAQQRPELKLVNTTIEPPSAAEVEATPDLAGFLPYSVCAYVPKEEPKLEKAMTAAIREMYENGELAALLTKWNVDPEVWLVPYEGAAAERQGVDRPADWTPPSI